MSILIKNGRVLDPASDMDDFLDVLIKNDRIVDIAREINAPEVEIIDAAGCLVLPGLIDMHVHFREPGREDIETIIGGSLVAAKSGFTSVCTMPNTNPYTDNTKLVKYIKQRAEKGPVNVFPIASISKEGKGREINKFGELVDAGAVGFSDDGHPVMSSLLMRQALENRKRFNVPIITHSEDITLSKEGVMNEGEQSAHLGLKGIPKEAEEIMISRDVILTRLTESSLHVAHVSSSGSIDIIKHAKERGISVTCETAPHYFSLTDDAVGKHLSMAKMNPPLRTIQDRNAIIEGLRNGTIDVIATDHAPHLMSEKNQGIENAPFGIIGLETAVPLIITILVMEYNLTYKKAFEKVTINPARILGLDRGELKPGGVADVVVINPEKTVSIDEKFLVSKCKNTPFIGRNLYGIVEYTICNGSVVYQNTEEKFI